MIQFKSIRTKMIAGFAIVLILLMILALFSLTIVKNGNKTIETILEKELPLLIADEQLNTFMFDRMGAARGYVLTGDPLFKELFTNTSEKITANQDFILSINDTDEMRQLFADTTLWQDYITEEVFGEYDNGNEQIATENMIQSDSQVNPLIGQYEKMISSRENHIITLEEDLLAGGQKTILIVFIISIIAILITILITIITPNSITRPLHVVMNRMKLIATGDLSNQPLAHTTKDEIGQLVTATNDMTLNTHTLLTQIQSLSNTVTMHSGNLTKSAHEVQEGTNQISTTMEDLAQGTESQATNISMLSSNMENFVVKVIEANDNGEFIQQASASVLDMTSQGIQMMDSSTKQMALIDSIVHEAVGNVEGLDKHAQEISAIVSVIQDIAGQTNLLALNAAIEAARAGEHGKGFAVVADEVRKLAEQSASSVTTITEIVGRIQNESTLVAASLQTGYKEVEAGSSQIKTTGKTFSHISTAVSEMVERIHVVTENLASISLNGQEMNGSIEEIAAISEESAAGVEQTAASSQQASSAMEELASSAVDLSQLAEDLNLQIQKFKL